MVDVIYVDCLCDAAYASTRLCKITLHLPFFHLILTKAKGHTGRVRAKCPYVEDNNVEDNNVEDNNVEDNKRIRISIGGPTWA